jgi:hypothetical protein
VTPEAAYTSARLTALSILGSLQRELGDPRSGHRLAPCVWNGHLGSRSSPAANRDQWLLRSDSGALRVRCQAARSLGSRHGRAAVRDSGGDRGGGRDQDLMEPLAREVLGSGRSGRSGGRHEQEEEPGCRRTARFRSSFSITCPFHLAHPGARRTGGGRSSEALDLCCEGHPSVDQRGPCAVHAQCGGRASTARRIH